MASRRLLAVDGEAHDHDAAGNTISIGGKAFQPLQRAIWLDNYPVALINAPSAGVPEVAYVQPDHPATPRVAVDPVRDVAIWEWSSKSEVFGNQVPNADADGDGVGFELALRFPGQQATDASGMFYNCQRDYDPTVGRYSQGDPLGLNGGINAYSYVGGAPVSYVDAAGLFRYHPWVNSKYPNTVAYLNGLKDRMTPRKYLRFECFGKIGRQHLDQLLEECGGPVVTPKYLPHDHGSYTPGQGEIFILESHFDRFEAGDRSQDLLDNMNRTLEHELVHFTENFWNKNRYFGEGVGGVKNSSMEQGSRASLEFSVFVAWACLVVSLAGCSRVSSQASLNRCDSDAVAVIQAVSLNREFNNYAADHFNSSNIVVLWDSMPQGMEICEQQSVRFKFARSSSKFDRNSAFIYIGKLYVDGDAAFVELGFPPTGKSGDAFLRRQSGAWLVTQSALWEN